MSTLATEWDAAPHIRQADAALRDALIALSRASRLLGWSEGKSVVLIAAITVEAARDAVRYQNRPGRKE